MRRAFRGAAGTISSAKTRDKPANMETQKLGSGVPTATGQVGKLHIMLPAGITSIWMNLQPHRAALECRVKCGGRDVTMNRYELWRPNTGLSPSNTDTVRVCA